MLWASAPGHLGPVGKNHGCCRGGLVGLPLAQVAVFSGGTLLGLVWCLVWHQPSVTGVGEDTPGAQDQREERTVVPALPLVGPPVT